jgi:hypothetical protein
LWNNSTQISATVLNVNHLDRDGIDINLFLNFLVAGDSFYVQDDNNSSNYQRWNVTATPTDLTTYSTLPVSLITSSGTGTTGFSNNESIIVSFLVAGAVGPMGPTVPTGAASTVTGPTGATGPTGPAGIAAVNPMITSLLLGGM